ncbi:MAG: VWA domain-containing protein [Chloroflexi bacterium]|nr:VWA domain-containing protein [Chloroflexota bacterium]
MRYAFEQPVWLLLLAGIPVVLLLALRWYRTAAPWRAALAILLRTALLAALILALARPTLWRPDQQVAVAFVVDQSDSMGGPIRAAADGWIQQALGGAQQGDRVNVIRFGRQAVAQTVAIPSAEGQPPTLGPAPSGVDATATNLEAGLRMAGDLLPKTGERRVIVVSDGWENVGDAESAALGGGLAGLPVDFAWPSAVAGTPEVAVRAVESPRFVREGATFEAVVVVDSTVEADATVRLAIDGKAVSEESVHVSAGTSRFTLPLQARTPGARAIHAEIRPSSDTRPENNAANAVTVVKEAGRVLVLEGHSGEGQAVAGTLTDAGVDVEIQAPASVPPRPELLDRFDGIVLANVAATQLALDQQRTIQQFVRDMGRGLVVAGGNTSFALGGYAGSVLDDLLPVSPAPPPRRDDGTVALFLVLDKSGSMDLYRSNEVSKIAMAREAAILSVEALRPNDTLGVLGFDSRFAWVVPPIRISGANEIREAQNRIGTIVADGGTSIYPALEEAYKAALQSDARLKHIILMTDGQSFDADYATLVAKMRSAQITLSAIAMGSDSDTKLLTNLAQMGAGRYYFTERPADIPKITTRETSIVTRTPMVEGRVLPRETEPSPILLGLSGSVLPPISGYVTTEARPRAVMALTTDRGDPLLAHWQHGLGRVVAWTSDTSGPWTVEWQQWPEYERFWQQAVRWTLPEPTRADFAVNADVNGDRVALRAQSIRPDGRFGDLLDTRVTVLAPDGSARELPLPQTAPGTYSTATTAGQAGAYEARFVQYEGGKAVREETIGFTVAGGAEQRNIGVNRALLERLAARTGGHELTDPSAAFARDDAPRGESPTPLWFWFVLAGLLLLPLDVAIRRLAWGRRR